MAKWLHVSDEVDEAGLSPEAFRILAHLSRCEKEKAEYTMESISCVCRISLVSVALAIRELETAGFLK